MARLEEQAKATAKAQVWAVAVAKAARRRIIAGYNACGGAEGEGEP